MYVFFFSIVLNKKKVSIAFYVLMHLHKHYCIMFAKFLQCDRTPLKEFQYLFIFKKMGNYRTLVKAVECISLYKIILVLRILLCQ